MIAKLASWARRTYDDETGAITVDWVVLTAAVAALSIATFAVFGPNLIALAAWLDDEVFIQTAF